MNTESQNAAANVKERLAAAEMPDRIKALDRDARGYPVPKFVLWQNGVPDFRIMDTRHMIRCVNKRRCWVCGQQLGRYMTFVVGPMCIINRTSSEPPSHRECGRYAARVCPFLAIPAVRRQQHGLPEGVTSAGTCIQRNPGVGCLWTVEKYETFCVDNGVLFQMGDPTDVEWWSRGREATRAEVEESIRTGLPLLEEIAREEGDEALTALAEFHERAKCHLPAAAP